MSDWVTLSQKQNSTVIVLENTTGKRKTCSEFNTQVGKEVWAKSHLI